MNEIKTECEKMKRKILTIMLMVLVSLPQYSGEIIILFDESHVPVFTVNPAIPAYDSGGGYENLSCILGNAGYTIKTTNVTKSWIQNDSYAYPGAIGSIYVPKGNTSGYFNLTNYTMEGFNSMYSMIMAELDSPINVSVDIEVQGYNNETAKSFGTDYFVIPAGENASISHRWVGEVDILRDVKFSVNISSEANRSFTVSFYRWYPLIANYTIGEKLSWNSTGEYSGLKDTNLLIIPGSKWNYSSEEVDYIKQFIKQGGSVLFMEKAYDYNNGTNNLLEELTELKVISMVESNE